MPPFFVSKCFGIIQHPKTVGIFQTIPTLWFKNRLMWEWMHLYNVSLSHGLLARFCGINLI